MNRPVDAIVTGFARNGQLCVRAFEPLLKLKQEGLLRAIHYVTWTSCDIDAFVDPIAALPHVEVTRVPMPVAFGNGSQKGLVYQVHNLGAALDKVAGDETLVVKLRPDFVIRTDFLRAKIREFEHQSVIVCGARAFGVALPRVPLERKIWIPWADANQPFFFEDAAFMGLKRDLALLVTPHIRESLSILEDEACGPFAHVLRWASAFLLQFPIFTRYLEEYGAFPNVIEYRKTLIPLLLEDPFFWHLIVANAWILWTGFHIDCGHKGDLLFFANRVNQDADWSSLAALSVTPPYDDVEQWRVATRANFGLLPAVDRLYGRLVDDAWPSALFSHLHSDVPLSTLTQIALVLSRPPSSSLRKVELTFFDRLKRHHASWRARHAA